MTLRVNTNIPAINSRNLILNTNQAHDGEIVLWLRNQPGADGPASLVISGYGLRLLDWNKRLITLRRVALVQTAEGALTK